MCVWCCVTGSESVCVCVECIQHSRAPRLGSHKQDKTASEGKEENFSGNLQQEGALEMDKVIL